MNTQFGNSLPADFPIETKAKLFTLREAAKLLRRKPNWLYLKTKEKSIPHRRFGKYIVFTEADIEAIIAMSLRGPGAPQKISALAEGKTA